MRVVLPSMAERFPEVTVDIGVVGRLVDIVAGGFDAAEQAPGRRPVGGLRGDGLGGGFGGERILDD